jgi:ATP-dependent Clp protease ATP-binding subunit ClpX
MPKMDDKKSIRCSFCGKTQNQVERIIAGNGSYICDECVRLCMSIVDENFSGSEKGSVNMKSAVSLGELPKPAEIKTVLDEYIVGQDQAKLALSVAV